MVFSKISIKRSHKNSTEKPPTETELQKILDLLNEEDFETRVGLSVKHSYKEPEDLELDDHCHATARKYADANKGLLTPVPGYLISPINTNASRVDLEAHSVVQDTVRKELVELIPPLLYTLEQYHFIEHKSGIRGHDLEAWV
jgi:hypothetical protein